MNAKVKSVGKEKRNIETIDSQWNWLYKIGGAAALTAMFANLLDVVLGFGGTEVVTYGTKSAVVVCHI
jgi:hypothetical protein